ncbi:MAG: metallophosphoesterase [Rhodothermales bacterium]
MTRIAHISDIHFGRIAHPGIVDSLVDDINAAGVDLVVVSGDLTQRAFGHQFRAARRMLKALDAPPPPDARRSRQPRRVPLVAPVFQTVRPPSPLQADH